MAEVRLIGGVEDLHNALMKAARGAPRKAAQVVQEAGTKYQTRAKYFAPVDTGKLRGGIVIEPGGTLKVTVTSTVPYSGWVHDGTSRQSPQPYMAEAERSTTPDVIDALKALGGHLDL